MRDDSQQLGLVGSVIQWFTHAGNSQGSPAEWAAGLVLILMVSFFWVTVINKIE